MALFDLHVQKIGGVKLPWKIEDKNQELKQWISTSGSTLVSSLQIFKVYPPCISYLENYVTSSYKLFREHFLSTPDIDLKLPTF